MSSATRRLPRPRAPLHVGLLVLAPAVLVAAVVAGPVADVLDARLFTAVLALYAVAGAGLLILTLNPAWTITLGFGLTIFSGQWSNLGVPVGIDRLLLIGGIARVLHGMLVARDLPRVRLTTIHWVLAATSVYAIGSALFAGTLLQAEPLFALTDSLPIIGFALFAIAPAVFADERSRRVVLALLVALGAYLGITAVLEQFAPAGMVFPRYIANEGVGIHFGRARGPFVEAAAMGIALYTCAIASAIASRLWTAPWARRCALATVGLCLLGIVLTLTRQVWVGAALGTLVMLVVVPELRRFIVPAVVGVSILLTGVLTLSPAVREKVTERATDRRPVWDRLNSNNAGLKMLVERPLVGFGWYRFGEEGARYYRQSPDYPLTTVARIHNVYLSRAVELGLVGGILWLVALVAGIGSALLPRPGPSDVELWRVGLIGVFTCWLVVANFTPLGYPFANLVIWLWAGIVLAGSAQPAAPPAVRARATALS